MFHIYIIFINSTWRSWCFSYLNNLTLLFLVHLFWCSFSISGFSCYAILLYSICKAWFSLYLLFWYSICSSQFFWYLTFWYITLLSGFFWYQHFWYNSRTSAFSWYFAFWCSIFLVFFFYVLFYRFFLIIISPFYCLFFLSWIFMFVLLRFKSFCRFADNSYFLINTLWHSWNWQCSETAIESIKSSGKHCNKLILYNFPMSAICRFLKEFLYLNLINWHSHLYYANQTDIKSQFPKLEPESNY